MRPIFAQDVLLWAPGKALGKYCPPASFISIDSDSHSICRVTASNQGQEQTNPDRSSHLRFTLGQLWCNPKREPSGGSQYSVMYAECLHVLDDSNTSACHKRHQFYLVTALWGNPYDCSAVRTLLIVIYLSGVIMLSGGWQRNIMVEVSNEGQKHCLLSVFCVYQAVTTKKPPPISSLTHFL